MSLAHRNYFDEIAVEWNDRVQTDPCLAKHIKNFGIHPTDRVLDIGAGTGRLSKVLIRQIQKPGAVVALDFAQKMLTRAQSELGNTAQYICADACELVFRDNTFHKVICYSTFPHILEPQQALNEIYRVLKPQGKLLILHNCCSKKLNDFHSSLNPVVCRDILPLAKKLKILLEQIGFDCKTAEHPDLYWVEAIKE
ncbi:methyltransferase domain-containing protein [candidate division KSB1 bacterium]|nr:methyltransferase domain-containing protein [candidate division KSB1 bacterium]